MIKPSNDRHPRRKRDGAKDLTRKESTREIGCWLDGLEEEALASCGPRRWEQMVGSKAPKSDCSSCGGSGRGDWCEGSGNCDMCGGTGKKGNKECPSCSGSGNCSSCGGAGKCYWCSA